MFDIAAIITILQPQGLGNKPYFMDKYIAFLFFACLVFWIKPKAQTLFVDPHNGKENATGSMNDPLPSNSIAVSIAKNFTGNETVTIKLYPGLYLLDDQVELKPFNTTNDTIAYSFEAVTLPDDSAWAPYKMPVIQSVPRNTRTGKVLIIVQASRSNAIISHSRV